ncbi:MAG: energy transducer TonB [Burkholderiales bacterium]
MSDAISRLLVERERQDHGLPTTLLVSLTGHFGIAGLAVLLPLILPQDQKINVADGYVVVLPRGGGGTPQVTTPPAPEPAAKPKPEESAAPPAPPVVLKPPPKAEPRPNALPLPDSKTRRPPTPPPVRATTKPATTPSAGSSGTTSAAKSAAGATGIEIGLPPGPGLPTGTDSGGDWYLASVQQKIWMIWNQQVKTGFTQSVGVEFTIMPDGSVTGLRVTQSSGSALLDLAAQRAVQNAGPFAPLPREYGQNPRTIQALFKPTT